MACILKFANGWLDKYGWNNLLGVFVYFREDILLTILLTKFLNETLT